MFCPQCELEYREGFTRCTECNVPLVEALPEVKHEEPGEMVTVLAVTDPAILAMAESLLDANGIPYASNREELHSILGWSQAAQAILGELLIQVPSARADEARELLAGLEEAPTAPENQTEDEAEGQVEAEAPGDSAPES